MNDSDQLKEYLTQLSAVEEALKHAGEDQKAELLDLKLKLLELVSLLQRAPCDLSVDANESNKTAESSIDDEFARFQKEIMELDGDSSTENKQVDSFEDSSSNDSIDKPNEELSAVLSSLEGSKCRAPYSYHWGEKDYHNAMILSTDFELGLLEDSKDFEVSVMFCNPMCDKMKPCSFFLNGHCKFSDDMCRFSHGYKVKFSELQEFVLPDFSRLKVDAKCLAKGKDDLWQSATVEKCLPHQVYVVKNHKTGRTVTLDIHDIMPLDNSEDVNSSEEIEFDSHSPDYDRMSEQNILDTGKNAFYFSSTSSYAPAVWEQHTKGIGSRLMEKMGHVWGQGLGKNSDGRLEPIEAVILPTGKSLDKCIEMRDRCNPNGPIALETKLELEQEREKVRAKKAPADGRRPKKKNVFDFINSRISKVKSDDHPGISRSHHVSKGSSSSSNKNLNVQIFSVGEDIKKAKRELGRLQQSLERNIDRNEAIRSQVQKKIAAQNDLLQSLQLKEQRLSDSIVSQTNKKKLAIF